VDELGDVVFQDIAGVRVATEHQLGWLATKPMKSMAISTFCGAKARLLSRKFKLGQPIALR
jgi:hypothetical protein